MQSKAVSVLRHAHSVASSPVEARSYSIASTPSRFQVGIDGRPVAAQKANSRQTSTTVTVDGTGMLRLIRRDVSIRAIWAHYSTAGNPESSYEPITGRIKHDVETTNT